MSNYMQTLLALIEKKRDAYIVLSDSKLDAKLEVYKAIDNSCFKLIKILEDYQNSLYVYANEKNSLAILLKECSKHDKTKAGKIMAATSKGLMQSSHNKIKLYMPLMRLYQEMETFHSKAVDDTTKTVSILEDKRSHYRTSLSWMKNISEKLDPDMFVQMDKFRKVQNQVRIDKKIFDEAQMDTVQKIDLLSASRCNLLNQILASYQAVLLDTFERNSKIFKHLEEVLKKEDLYDYEFKTLEDLNPPKIDDSSPVRTENTSPIITEPPAQEEDLLKIEELDWINTLSDTPSVSKNLMD